MTPITTIDPNNTAAMKSCLSAIPDNLQGIIGNTADYPGLPANTTIVLSKTSREGEDFTSLIIQAKGWLLHYIRQIEGAPTPGPGPDPNWMAKVDSALADHESRIAAAQHAIDFNSAAIDNHKKTISMNTTEIAQLRQDFAKNNARLDGIAIAAKG